MCNYLSSLGMTKTGPPADLFSSSSEAKSAGKDLNPIFIHVFVGPLAMIGKELKQSSCVSLCIFGGWRGGEIIYMDSGK